MRLAQLLMSNLRFHRRAHLAVLLGVAVGTAVLTGALLVGDSLRGSLKDRADQQRCGVDLALVTNHFFTATVPTDAGRSQAGILMRGSLQAGESDAARHVNGVTVLAGLDLAAFASGSESGPEQSGISADLARQLGVKVGDPITVRIPVPATVPSESVMGQRDLNQTSIEIITPLQTILPDDHPASVFRLYPGFAAPRNVILPLGLVQQKLARFTTHLAAVDRLMSAHNAILATGTRQKIADGFAGQLTLADWDLKWGAHPYLALEADADRPRPQPADWTRILAPAVAAAIDADRSGTVSTPEMRAWFGRHGYLSLESQRGVLESTTADTTLRTAREMKLQAAPTLIYLANSLAHEKQSIPYSIVAALEPNLLPPLGPFLPPGVDRLNDDEIVLTDWPDSPLLGLSPGVTVTLTYFQPELRDGQFVESTATFKLRGYLPLKESALDPQLTPQFRGVTDRLSVRQWNPPFPYENKRMGPKDEEYWKQYRTIPKAFITLSAGRKLWASRYGNTTSVRIAPAAGETWAKTQIMFEQRLSRELKPEQGGFVFDDLKDRFAAASEGGQDFGGLFLGFSFFLIVAALLLVGLLTRLNLERRASEIGLLLATGWRVRTVRWLLLLEGTAVAAVGGLVGLAAAIGYAAAMLELMRRLWPDASVGSFLRLHLSAVSLAAGYFATLLVSVGTIFWALRGITRVSTSALIAGQTEPVRPAAAQYGIRQRIVLPVLILCLLVGLSALVAGGKIANPMFRALTFFSGGAMLLTAALMLIWRLLKHEPRSTLAGHGLTALARLGGRNAHRNPGRSILTAGLLACAAFLLVAVESFRREPEGDFARKEGGSGGCPVLIETTQPVIRDLNSDGRDDLLSNLQRYYQSHANPAMTPEKQTEQARETLEKATIFSFRKSSGDDASCLNLYQAGRPQVLGVPAALIDRGGFRFIESEARTPEEKANPWLLLRQAREDGTIPVVAEENTITWMLKKGLGDELTLPDESGRPVKLRIVGVLKDSVFQSELLVSSESFRSLFPHTEGFTYHLVAAEPEQAPALAELLRIGLGRYEPELTFTRDRVAIYMAVENTYLTTFQLLGGLGLLLGALGLAVVMLRGVWERRSELALLRALGYRHRALGLMVLAENALLLLLGLAAGAGAAALSVLPHLALGGSVPWARLALLLGAVTFAGLLAGAGAVRFAVRAPLLAALRKE